MEKNSRKGESKVGMIEKEELEKQAQEQVSEAISSLGSFLKKGDREDIHRLRVAIKKIRALAWLLEKCGRLGKLKKYIGELKKIFRQAGKIRSAQMNISLIKDFGKSGRSIVGAEKRKERTATYAFKKKVPAYRTILSDLAKKDLALKPVRKKKALRVYLRSLKKVDSLLHIDKDELTHEGRKKIKRLIHNYTLFDKKAKSKLDLDIKFLIRTEKVIGEWHDSTIALGLAKRIPDPPAGALLELQRETAKKERKVSMLVASFHDKILKK